MAVAGICFGARTSFTPEAGPASLLYAFEAVLIGGVGSLGGIFTGAVVLGVAQAVLAQHTGINPFLAVPAAGSYFAVGTWVVAEVFRTIVSNLGWLGGGLGQSLTVMARIPRDNCEITTYARAVALLLACFAAMQGLTAVRDSEATAESQGVAVAALDYPSACCQPSAAA